MSTYHILPHNIIVSSTLTVPPCQYQGQDVSGLSRSELPNTPQSEESAVDVTAGKDCSRKVPEG